LRGQPEVDPRASLALVVPGLLAAGGTANHLHLLVSLPPAMRDLKGNSSRMLSEMVRHFAWQGCGAFSVSHSQRQVVADYIANQKAHH